MDADFSYLPHDPRRFFGLEPGFDRRDLKRSYTRLLKRYKPERHPEEFQLLRAAFERLDAQLRSETSAPEAESPRLEDPRPSLSRSPEPPAEARSLHDASSSEDLDPAERYRRLVERGPSSPREALDAALLSEVVGAAPERFLDPLIAGLREFPQAWYLAEAVDRWLEERLAAASRSDDPEAAFSILERLAAELPPATYYFVTATSWRWLALHIDPTRWELGFERCEKRLRGGDVVARFSFLVSIVSTSLFRLPLAWVLESVAWLQSHAADAPEFDDDLDLLEAQVEYLRERPQFLAGGDAARAAIDRLLRDQCEQPRPSVDAAFFHAMSELRELRRELQAEFPAGDRSGATALRLVSYYAVGYAMHYGLDERLLADHEAQQRVSRFLFGVQRRTEAGPLGKYWNSLGVLNVAYILVVVLLPVKLVTLAIGDGQELQELSAGLVIVWGGIFFLLRRWTLHPFRHWLAALVATRSYQRLWRGQLFEFIEDNALTLDMMRTAVEAIQHDEIDIADWLGVLMSEDDGLGFHALAHRFDVPDLADILEE